MVTWLIILLAISLVLFVAELFIPSGGLLGFAAAACLTAAIVICFVMNLWLGVGVLLGTLLLAPVMMNLGINLWQRTPIGKRMIVTATVGELPRPQLLVGSTGVALTEMRPMGEIEIGEMKVEAISEMAANIPAGRKVKVLSISGNVATVRELKESA